MVNLQIITNDENTAQMIIDHLIKERFVLEGILLENIQRKHMVNGEITTARSFLIKALAKALLFKSINQYIHDHFQDSDIVVYSIPIVDMDWDVQKSLINNTRTV